jgi:rhodanese-related sulfurtransferase
MKKSTTIILLILAAALILMYMYAPFSPKQDGSLDPAKISREVTDDKAVLMDVRTAAELAIDGYAVDSTHFELVRLQNGELPVYSRDMKIYVYCKAGGRAGQAETILEENGFTNVVNIGGLIDWETAGGDVVR